MVVVRRHLPGGHVPGLPDTLKVVIPDEGAMFWTDNMCIPIYAENPLDAMTYMDSVYDPQVAGARSRTTTRYVCPVPAAQEIIRERPQRPDGRQQPDGLPDARDGGAVTHLLPRTRTRTDLTAWNDTFVPIFQG